MSVYQRNPDWYAFDPDTLADINPAIVYIGISNSNHIDCGCSSGFIVSEDGLIVTIKHVVENKDTIELELESGTKCNMDQDLDIVALKLCSPMKLPVLQLAQSADVHLGDGVFGIGHPGGLRMSINIGTITNVQTPFLGVNGDFVEHNVPLNHPGSSGGPLINRAGKVIGMNTFRSVPDKKSYGITSGDIRRFLNVTEPTWAE